MLEKGKITVQQLTTLALLITVGDSILILPAIPALEAKQDAWLAMLLGLVLGLFIVYGFTLLAKLYPELTLVEYNQKILGKTLGTQVSMYFLLYLFLSVTAQIREIGDFAVTIVIPETPILAIHGLLILVVVMAVRYGLDTIARSSEILYFLFIVLFLFLIITLIHKIEFKNLQPLLEEGFKPVIRGSLASTAFPFMELVVFLMILPYVKQDKTKTARFLFGVFRGGLNLLIITTLCILILGSDHSARQLYPSYMLAQKAGIPEVIERIESILALIWLITAFFKISIHVYALHLGLGQLLKLRDYRSLTFPIALLLLLFSNIISPNPIYYFTVITKYWIFYDFTLAVCLPLLLFSVYAFRKRILGNKLN